MIEKNHLDNIHVLTDESSRAYMQMQLLRTNILQEQINQNFKVLLVTPAGKQNDTIAITLNLGLSLAKIQKKIIVIDANIQSATSSISEFDNSKINLGLSDYLRSERPLNLDEIIEKTSIENLFIIRNYNEIKNSADLLANGRMRELLSQLESRFDFVLVGAPAVLVSPDTLILANLIPQSLLLMSLNQVTKVELRNTIYRLQQSTTHLLGWIKTESI